VAKASRPGGGGGRTPQQSTLGEVAAALTPIAVY